MHTLNIGALQLKRIDKRAHTNCLSHTHAHAHTRTRTRTLPGQPHGCAKELFNITGTTEPAENHLLEAQRARSVSLGKPNHFSTSYFTNQTTSPSAIVSL